MSTRPSSDIFGTVAKGSSMSKSSPQGALHYAGYLHLAALLAAQAPESARHGRPAHDEMLFIIVHQTYELWFKQILHELDRIQVDFGGEVVEDEYLGRIVHGLERINEILKLLIQQLEVLETMTPLDFLDFRDFLFPASGFQSAQFRLIEIKLGLARGTRSHYPGHPHVEPLPHTHPYHTRPSAPSRLSRTRLPRSQAYRPARPIAFAHAVRAPARLRFLARIPQSGEADARRRRGAPARQRGDEPAAAGGRSQTHRSIARG